MRTKDQKQALKLEAARLTKVHRARSEWTQDTIARCEALADRYLSHGPGRPRAHNRADIRSKLPDIEIPCSHLGDYTALSPIVYLIP